MPIEIRELVIKATVGESNATGSTESSPSDGGGIDEERLVRKVVEKVMELIKMRADR